MRLFPILALLALLIFDPAHAAGGKTLRMAYDADPASLDPHEQLSGATLQLSHLVFDPLVRFRKDLTLEPRLAKSWEQIDERTTRFHLRDDVRFHSGRRMTAEDVAWTFDRLKRSPDFKALFEPFEAAKVVDDQTIDLITKGPYPLVLNLATYIFPMDREFYTGTDARGAPKDAVVKHGSSFASANMSGTGPFIVTEREQGIRLELKRFDGLLGQGVTRQCGRDRPDPHQGAGDAGRGAACRRRRLHRPGAPVRPQTHSVGGMLRLGGHNVEPRSHLRTE